MCRTAIIEQPFPENPAATGYCFFPAELEDDDLVFFHATPVNNIESIIEHGFRIPDKSGVKGLPSVSFAKKSVGALNHAMSMRQKRPGEYCILAVRYQTLDRVGLKVNYDDIHDYTLEPHPEVISYCKVPASYQHL
jgi:hypothetical protein